MLNKTRYEANIYVAMIFILFGAIACDRSSEVVEPVELEEQTLAIASEYISNLDNENGASSQDELPEILRGDNQNGASVTRLTGSSVSFPIKIHEYQASERSFIQSKFCNSDGSGYAEQFNTRNSTSCAERFNAHYKKCFELSPFMSGKMSDNTIYQGMRWRSEIIETPKEATANLVHISECVLLQETRNRRVFPVEIPGDEIYSHILKYSPETLASID